jgi:hypothetical protein
MAEMNGGHAALRAAVESGAARTVAGLVPVRCANPGCSSTAHGQPRFLFEAHLPPAAAVRARCPKCSWVTTVTTAADGSPAYGCRPGDRRQEACRTPA